MKIKLFKMSEQICWFIQIPYTTCKTCKTCTSDANNNRDTKVNTKVLVTSLEKQCSSQKS